MEQEEWDVIREKYNLDRVTPPTRIRSQSPKLKGRRYEARNPDLTRPRIYTYIRAGAGKLQRKRSEDN